MARPSRKWLAGLAAIAIVTAATALGIGINRSEANTPSLPLDTRHSLPTDGVGWVDHATASAPAVLVNDMVVIGNTVFVGGAFQRVVRVASGSGTVDQSFLAAFDGSTGRWLEWFRPLVDGPVNALAVTPDNKLLVGGEFSAINRVAGTAGLAKLDPATAQVDPSWQAQLERGPANTNPIPPFAREINLSKRFIYVAGNFTRAVAQDGTTAFVRNVVRLDIATGKPDTTWRPQVNGGVWAIAPLQDDSRVFLGGRFLDVAKQPRTTTLAAVDGATGAVVPNWQGGLPWEPFFGPWPGTGGIIYGLGVVGDKLYIGGAEHKYGIKRTTDGANLAIVSTSNDTQRVDVIGNDVYIGCHCWGDGYFVRHINGITGALVSNPTAMARGGDGGWAATRTPDGCVWWGGHFSTSVVSGRGNIFIGHMGRTCPVGGPAAHRVPPISPAVKTDTEPPTRPRWINGARANNGKFRLQWGPASDDSGVVSYRVYRNNVLIDRTRDTSIDDTVGLSGNHTYAVVAYDPSGKAASTVSFTVGGGGPAPAAPAAPTNVKYSTNADFTPVITWDRPSNTNVVYVIRRNGREISRFVPERTVLRNLANIGNTVNSAGNTSNVAGLFDNGITNTSAGAVNTDLGASRWITAIAIRYASSAEGIFLSDQPMTSWNTNVLRSTPGVTFVPTPNNGGVFNYYSQQIGKRARYVRVITGGMGEYGVYSGDEPMLSFTDHTAPVGDHTWEIQAIQPHESASSTVTVTGKVPSPGLYPTLTAPTRGTTWTIDTPLALSADVWQVRVRSRKVDFKVDGAVVATNSTATSSPWTASWTPRKVGTYTLVATATGDNGTTYDSSSVRIEVTCPAGREAQPDGTCRVWSRGSLVVAESSGAVSVFSRTKSGGFLGPQSTTARGTSATGAELNDERLSVIGVLNTAPSYSLQREPASPNWTAGNSPGGGITDGSLVTRPDGTQVLLASNGSGVFINGGSRTFTWGGWAGLFNISGTRVDGAVGPDGNVLFAYQNGGAAFVMTERGRNVYNPAVRVGGSGVTDLSIVSGPTGALSMFVTTPLGVLSSTRAADGTWPALTPVPTLGRADRISVEVVDGRLFAAIVRDRTVFVSAQAADGSWPAPERATNAAAATDVDVVSNRVGGVEPAISATVTAPAAGATDVFVNRATTVTANVVGTRTTPARVEFFANGAPIGTATAAPWTVSWTPTAWGQVRITAKVTATTNETSTSRPVELTVACFNGRPQNPDRTCGRGTSRGTVVTTSATNQVNLWRRTEVGTFEAPTQLATTSTNAAGAELPGERLGHMSMRGGSFFTEQTAAGSTTWSAERNLGGGVTDGALLTRPDGSAAYLVTNGRELYSLTRRADGTWSSFKLAFATSGNRVDGAFLNDGRALFAYLDRGAVKSVVETGVGSDTYRATGALTIPGATNIIDLTVTLDSDGTPVAYLLDATGVLVSRLQNGAWTTATRIDSLAGAAGPNDRIAAEVVENEHLVGIVRAGSAVTSLRSGGAFPTPVALDTATNHRDIDVISNRLGGA